MNWFGLIGLNIAALGSLVLYILGIYGLLLLIKVLRWYIRTNQIKWRS